MKRILFSLAFSLLCYALVVGFMFLPESWMYVHKSTDANKYTLLTEVWSNVGMIILGVVFLNRMQKMGEKIFDYYTLYRWKSKGNKAGKINIHITVLKNK